jgi:hypothetical protein
MSFNPSIRKRDIYKPMMTITEALSLTNQVDKWGGSSLGQES